MIHFYRCIYASIRHSELVSSRYHDIIICVYKQYTQTISSVPLIFPFLQYRQNTGLLYIISRPNLTAYSAAATPHKYDRDMPLQWRNNRRDGVSNHRRDDCLLNRLFRCRSNKTSTFRVTGLCARNSPVTGEFLAQKASTAENGFHMMTSSCGV